MNLMLEQNENKSEELSQREKEYMGYLEQHISGVVKAFKTYFVPLVDTFKEDVGIYTNKEFILAIKTCALQVDKHDLSKYNDIEFYPYRRHFYPTVEEQNASEEDKQVAEEMYEKAWQHHYENNKHHIEYWYDAKNSIAHTPELSYIIEMFCDWFSMDQFYPKPEMDTWWRTDAEKERSMMTPETIETIDLIYAILKK